MPWVSIYRLKWISFPRQPSLNGGMRYEFRTVAGIFWITDRRSDPDGAVLGIDQITLGSYETASAAAADVAAQKTGWERWDTLLEVSVPGDLDEWEEIEEPESG